MAKEDEEKTSFITSQGIFHYSKMPFGLKYAKATYQRLVDKAFQKQIGRNLEVYVDNLVIKSRTEHEILRDIKETFKTLREINMKLNPKKCTFGIEEGMFLGYKVNTKGIKKCTKKSDFQWTAEAEAAFKEMKKLIAELHTLTAPKEKEELVVYLAATREAVSAVLMTERAAKQIPVYFVLSRPEVAGRLQKWSIELGKYDIQYRPRTSVKGQILSNFIVEHPEDDLIDTPMEAEEEFTYKSGRSRIHLRSKVQVPRSENKKADALSKIASTSFAHLTKQVLVEELIEKSINEAEVLAVVEEEGDTWMTAIYNCLAKEELHADKKKARAIRHKSGRYAVINKVLYKKSYLGPWLRCVGPLQANNVLREIHEGSCSMHAGTRSVVAKAIQTGYYWPTMHANARKMIRECQD
ncbi:reverse transcriptase domain-containing protein [Tanacetum coccineum]